MEQFPALGATPDGNTFNAVLEGCATAEGAGAAFDEVEGRMRAAGRAPNPRTWHLRVQRQIVAGDADAALRALRDMQQSRATPSRWLMERCLLRCERSGNREGIEEVVGMMHRYGKHPNPRMIGLVRGRKNA